MAKCWLFDGCPGKTGCCLSCQPTDEGCSVYRWFRTLFEKPHGHWNLIEDYDDDEHWKCSCCGEEWFLEAGNPTDNEMNYCPRCGAKMDEEVK